MHSSESVNALTLGRMKIFVYQKRSSKIHTQQKPYFYEKTYYDWRKVWFWDVCFLSFFRTLKLSLLSIFVIAYAKGCVFLPSSNHVFGFLKLPCGQLFRLVFLKASFAGSFLAFSKVPRKELAEPSRSFFFVPCFNLLRSSCWFFLLVVVWSSVSSLFWFCGVHVLSRTMSRNDLLESTTELPWEKILLPHNWLLSMQYFCLMKCLTYASMHCTEHFAVYSNFAFDLNMTEIGIQFVAMTGLNLT